LGERGTRGVRPRGAGESGIAPMEKERRPPESFR